MFNEGDLVWIRVRSGICECCEGRHVSNPTQVTVHEVSDKSEYNSLRYALRDLKGGKYVRHPERIFNTKELALEDAGYPRNLECVTLCLKCQTYKNRRSGVK